MIDERESQTLAPAVVAAARATRAAIEHLMDLLGWPHDPALSRAVDRLVEIECGVAERPERPAIALDEEPA